MELWKKVRDSFSRKKIVFWEGNGDRGPVLTMDIHGFGAAEDHVSIDTEHGEEIFRTLLKRLYHDVLHKDPSWHYFLEGKYNHLRFSSNFSAEVLDILNVHEAVYFEGPALWIDGQGITRKYQDIFKNLFHWFSVMAVRGYPEDDITLLLDRVIHCFMNHQQLYLLENRKQFGAMTEPILVAKYAAKRAEYIGYCSGVNKAKDWYEDHAKKCKDYYLDDCKKKREALDDYKESTDEMLELFAEMKPEEAKEALKYYRDQTAGVIEKIKEEAEEIIDD